MVPGEGVACMTFALPPPSRHGMRLPMQTPPAGPTAPPHGAPPSEHGGEPHALDLLWGSIDERRHADPALSYTASLLARAPTKPAQKLAEEAAECAIEAVRGDAAALVRESADLLFHLLVVLAGAGLTPADIYAELVARERAAASPGRLAKGRSKSGRKPARQVETTKIP